VYIDLNGDDDGQAVDLNYLDQLTNVADLTN
jgi:hypothetical protein